jgi:hypothetical protein
MTITAAEYQQGNASFGTEPSEHQICTAFVNDLWRIAPQCPQLFYFTHVDNGQRAGASVTSRKIAGGMAKAEGVKAGHPDYYFLFFDRFGLVDIGYIEFKTRKAGKKLKGAQKDFQAMCINAGIKHAVCISAGEAMEQLKQWGVI